MAEMVAALRYVRTERGHRRAASSSCSPSGSSAGRSFNLLVVFADDVYEVGDGAYGLLAGCMGAGAILAAPLVAGRRSRFARSRLVAIAMRRLRHLR